jgi:hypothetical protein
MVATTHRCLRCLKKKKCTNFSLKYFWLQPCNQKYGTLFFVQATLVTHL